MNSKEALFELYKQVKSHTRTTKQIIDNKQQYEQIGKDLNLFEEYKKIEEELGIDLITLFKALKQKEVYIKEGFCQEVWGQWEINKTLPIYLDYVVDNETYDDFINKQWVLTFTEWENGFDYHEMLVRLKDYGKTWAITKEEIENE